jgi:hypothetical protein
MKFIISRIILAFIISRIILALFGELPHANVETCQPEAVWVPEGVELPIVAEPFDQRVF